MASNMPKSAYNTPDIEIRLGRKNKRIKYDGYTKYKNRNVSNNSQMLLGQYRLLLSRYERRIRKSLVQTTGMQAAQSKNPPSFFPEYFRIEIAASRTEMHSL